jgi:hypothetical protein
MKALSIRQPWAELIVQGKKTLELRSWTVNYRGPLAIHASQTVEREACVANGLHPDSVTTGAIVGVVDLIDIVELDEAAYLAHRADHFAPDRFEPPLYGWQLQNAHALPQPRPMRGRMGLFTVADEWLSATVDHAPEPEPAPPAFEPTWNVDKPFELRVTPATERANHTA